MTYIVNFKDDLKNNEENKVHKAFIYYATAAFALIDNLENIHYNFNDVS